MTSTAQRPALFKAQHLLAISDLSPLDIIAVLDLAQHYAESGKSLSESGRVLAGQTQVNLFFENSTRTQSSFEIAGKRLGADVMNMAVATSSLS